MPFSPEQLSYAGRASIDYFLENDPVDQINTEHPFLKVLMEQKKEYAGGLQYVVEQLRYTNDSNFQGYFGSSQVTYNRKRTLQQAKYTWGAYHDGFGLDEDELAQNGINMTDDRNSVPTDAEKVQLTNLLGENTETLKLGFQENFDLLVHRNGTASAFDITGLDGLISLNPAAAGTIGTIDQVTNIWWRNNFSTGIAAANLLAQMEVMWRACTKYGGSKPTHIFVGSAMLDAYITQAGLTINRRLEVPGNAKGGTTLDAGVTGVYYKGIELQWDPIFDLLDTLDAPATPWAKRMYMLNMKHLKLRPIKGHWMVSRQPPRVYDRYVHYWALTAKASLTTNKRNAHAVLALS